MIPRRRWQRYLRNFTGLILLGSILWAFVIWGVVRHLSQ